MMERNAFGIDSFIVILGIGVIGYGCMENFGLHVDKIFVFLRYF